MYSLCHKTAERLHIGSHVRFIDAPILAKFVPGGVTGKIVARVGYRAYEIECDGHALAVLDFPENIEKCRDVTPYEIPAKFVSRRKAP